MQVSTLRFGKIYIEKLSFKDTMIHPPLELTVRLTKSHAKTYREVADENGKVDLVIFNQRYNGNPKREKRAYGPWMVSAETALPSLSIAGQPHTTLPEAMLLKRIELLQKLAAQLPITDN